MPRLELRGIENHGCHGIDLEVAGGEILSLLGPNGAGKTTLLNVIAGFTGYEGSVLIDDTPADHLSCHDRGVGFVFQDLALFPHMTGFENAAFGLRMKGLDDTAIRKKVAALLELTGVSNLAGIYPKTMSGGERQRIALARALATEPEFLLLDEPFAKLDPPSIKPLEEEMFKIIRHLNLTAIMVTHNIDTAFSAGDRIAIMKAGRILQVGLPGEIFRKPESRFVAEFMDDCNIYTGMARQSPEGLEIQINGIVIHAAGEKTGRTSISIRPDDILVSAQRVESSARNSFRGKITVLNEIRHLCHLDVDIGVPMRVVITRQSKEHMSLEAGSDIWVTFKASAVHLFN